MLDEDVLLCGYGDGIGVGVNIRGALLRKGKGVGLDCGEETFADFVC